MAGRGISTPAVAVAAAGALVVYVGIKGISLGSGVRSILAGQPPQLPAGGPLSGTFAAFGSHAVAAVDAATDHGGIAAAASRYLGSGSVYRWAGANPTSGWDCSGFVNWVLCHDLNRAIPGYKGGTFSGKAHGPPTGVWALWTGARTIPRAQVGAGDLVIWPAHHMGIAISNTQMVNCPGPNGTPAPVVGNIAGGGLGPLMCRRLKG